MKKRNFLLLTLGALLCTQASNSAMESGAMPPLELPGTPQLLGRLQDITPPPPLLGLPGMTPPPLPPSIIEGIDNRVNAIEKMIQKSNEKLDELNKKLDALLTLEEARESHFTNQRK